jgi:hypothetical protein
MEIGRHILLRGGFKAEGEVGLAAAQIGGIFHLRANNWPGDTSLDLRSCKMGVLFDKQKSWPARGNLHLNGLIYDSIYDKAPNDAESRIEWLSRQPEDQFRSQPYEQLAKVLREGGLEEDAKKIMIAKNKDELRLAKMPWWTKKWKQYLGHTIGFGYRPGRAFWRALGFIVLGSILFGIGFQNGVVTATYSNTNVEGEIINQEKSSVPKFNALMYSIDNFIPLVEFHEAENWLPDGNKGALLYDFGWWEFRTGSLLCAYMYVHIFSGWLLTTLLVVGLSGILRQY